MTNINYAVRHLIYAGTSDAHLPQTSRKGNSHLPLRNYLMGIAMLLVLLYHFTCWIGFRKLLLPFNWGFIGVDIFLFLSALGLGFSASKRTYKDFIRRRFIRIMPLYIFAAIVDSVLFHFTHNETLNLWDWICNITSLSYYGIGGYVRDWYLSSLLLLYIIFPILSYFVNKCKQGGVVASFFLSLLIVFNIEMPFQYNCFVSRIPIFLLGIYVFNKLSSDSANELNLFRWGYLAGILGIVIFIYANIQRPELLFISTALLALPLIGILLKWVQYIPQYVLNVICYMGKYSLEFYIANLCIHGIIGLTADVPLKIAIYILGNILLAILLIPLNRFCKSLFI